tara:strand:- start:94 stop:330 length:237 start_codon:yes stop_codon:yes gene_type:complete
MRSEEKLSEEEFNRVKYNYMKNQNKILDEMYIIIRNLSETTIQDMESKFDKKFEQEEIEDYVFRCMKSNWYDLYELLF